MPRSAPPELKLASQIRAKITEHRVIVLPPEVLARATVTPEEAAQVMGVSREAFDRELHAGRIPVLWFGRKPVIYYQGLLDVLEASTHAALRQRQGETECHSSSRNGRTRTGR